MRTLLSVIVLVPLLVLGGCPEDPEPDPLPETPRRAPEPDPWEPPGSLDNEAFPFGVQSGDATPDSAILSVWTPEPALTLEMVRGDDQQWVAVTDPPAVEVADGRAQLTVTGLEPDTAYSYAFYASDGSSRSQPGRFRTALAPGAERVVVLGGAHGFDDFNFPFPALPWAADERLDFFLMLGDTVYADGADEVEEYRVFYEEVFEQSGTRAISASTSFISTIDDHETANDWIPADIDEDQYLASIQVFREALPQQIGPGGTGIWHTLRWGATADVLVLDCRGERVHDDPGQYISAEQMAWLQDQLATSTARFKLIVNSVPITDYSPLIANTMAHDRWSGWPEDRQAILDFIDDEGIPGVLWITGDFHSANISHVGQPGDPGWDQWEVMVGVVGSKINPMGEYFDEDDQFTLMVAAWATTIIELDPGTGLATVRYVGEDGDVVREQVLEL